jgi:diguanylate cyclase (GGDEF)-like protein
VGLRILILGPFDGDRRREIAALGGGATILELAEGADVAQAIRSLSPDFAIVARPASHPAFLEAAARDALDRHIENEYLRSVRYRHPLGFAMLSLDHLEELDGTHGAAAVDAFLDSIAAAARRAIREVDLLFRPQRGELGVILPETEPAGARVVAERLRTTAGHLLFKPERPGRERPALPLKATVSVGVSGCPGGNVASGADLVAQARRGMDAARGAGGDRVGPSA